MASATTSGLVRVSSVPWQAADRWLASLCLVVCAATHVPLVPEHLREAPYVGVAFVVLIAASAILAATVVVRDTSTVWACIVALNVLAVLAYLVTRTIGLPLLHDDIGNWSDPLSFPALGSELLALAAAWSARGARVGPGAG